MFGGYSLVRRSGFICPQQSGSFDPLPQIFAGKGLRSDFHGGTPFGDFDLSGVSFGEAFAEGFGLFGFAVDEVDVLFATTHGVEVIEEFALVGVSAEGVEDFDFGPELEGIAEDVYFVPFVPDFPTEGVFGAVAYKEDGVSLVFDGVAEVVEDTTGFAHAGGGDDDGGFVVFVELFGLGDFANHGEVFEAEGVPLGEEEVVDFFVEAFGVDAEDLGSVDGEWAVDVDGDFGDEFFLGEVVEGVDELLGSLDGEGGDDDFAFFLEGFDEDVFEQVIGLGGELVFAVSVGALHKEDVDFVGGDGVTEQGVVSPTDVTGEEDALAMPALDDVEDDLGGAENVACVDECQGDSVGDGNGSFVADIHELTDALVGINL